MEERPGTQTLSRLRTGLLIREARQYAGLSQRELAARLGTKQSVVSRWAHGVDYVVIGGLAAVLHGSPTVTGEADICPERSNANLARLADALREMHAKIRTSAEPDGLEFARDAAFLSRMKMVNLTTDYGNFDLSFEPAGFT